MQFLKFLVILAPLLTKAWDIGKFEGKGVSVGYIRPLGESSNLSGLPESLRSHMCAKKCVFDQRCSAIELDPNGSCNSYGGLDPSFLQNTQGSSKKISYAANKKSSIADQFAFLSFYEPAPNVISIHHFNYGHCQNPGLFSSLTLPHTSFDDGVSFSGYAMATQTLVLCGGTQDPADPITRDNKCYLLKLHEEESPQWSDPLTMYTNRVRANTHSIGHLVYIFGGNPYPSLVEVIDTNAGTINVITDTNGNPLMMPLWGDFREYYMPCSVTLDESTILVLGGSRDWDGRYRKNAITKIDLSAIAWVNSGLPSLPSQRLRLACEKIKIGGEDHLLIMGGRHISSYDNLDSIEYLNLNNPTGWIKVPSNLWPPLNLRGIWTSRAFVIREFDFMGGRCDMIHYNMASGQIVTCTGNFVYETTQAFGEGYDLRSTAGWIENVLIPIHAQRFTTCP